LGYLERVFAALREDKLHRVLLVEQNVKQTLAIAHRGYVLSQGRVVAAGDADQLRENPDVREAYFGRQ